MRKVTYNNRKDSVNNSPNNQTSNITSLVQSYPNELGKVYLVGAGPGDPELLTMKAYRLLQSADIVLYDALISADILSLISENTKLVHVGKRANCHYVRQEDTNQMLVDYALQGLTVVRLKGGDPFIFGRGGEELQKLTAANISFEVVPGITAASGCASYAGIPLTHRDYAQSVQLVTAHQKESSSVNWKNLADENQTLVFYMGLMKNSVISNSLVQAGMKLTMPVAVVENGTRSNQRVFVGQLNKLSELVEQHSIKTPALIIVGEVASLAEQLAWFESSTKSNNEEYPLSGQAAVG